MSDIKDPLMALQQRMQQRQILALMGINQWVHPNSKTMNIADIVAPIASHMTTQSIRSHMSAEQPSIDDLNKITANSGVVGSDVVVNSDVANNTMPNTNSMAVVSAIVEAEFDSADNLDSAYDHDAIELDVNSFDADDVDLHRPQQPSPVSYHFDSMAAAPVLNADIDDIELQQTSLSTEQDYPIESRYDNTVNTLKVTPFDLQGGRYGDWVVFVDIQALNHDSQKLWQNITQALSITCETTSFPICAGMDTAELANASLAGYVFKIARSEEIKVAALTALPDGLEHPKLMTVPTLDEMLADSGIKRQFWAQLAD